MGLQLIALCKVRPIFRYNHFLQMAMQKSTHVESISVVSKDCHQRLVSQLIRWWGLPHQIGPVKPAASKKRPGMGVPLLLPPASSSASSSGPRTAPRVSGTARSKALLLPPASNSASSSISYTAPRASGMAQKKALFGECVRGQADSTCIRCCKHWAVAQFESLVEHARVP